ncbi:hypothetical protein [Fundidesulfovibrio agrisoli]|uniref:hypothetical protein n=1 Tax=Fundidesulfovibrio agrisoli TaxID=2922717 RepID=UPI001FAD4CCF|nr:hypothetical protein [Fundidesulfovibrio agrisoli]
MKTLTRLFGLTLALGLCLALSAPAADALAQDSTSKSQSQSQAKSKSKSKDSKDSKKSKKSGKSEGKSSKSQSGEKPSKKKAPSGEGFRGLAWGSPLSALNEPELREESGNLRYYTVPGDNMMVQGVEMREIVYVFCKDKLAGVLTRYDGQVNHLTLLGRLTDLHGAPLESPENLQGDRSWRFDAGDVSVMMEYSAKGSTGALAWFAKEPLATCQQTATP